MADKPTYRLMDPRFKWKFHGDVQAVWKRHGFKPTTKAERAARQLKNVGDAESPPLTVTELEQFVPKSTKLRSIK